MPTIAALGLVLGSCTGPSVAVRQRIAAVQSPRAPAERTSAHADATGCSVGAVHRRCNVGDMLARWTNELFVSTPHRVLRPVRSRPPPPWVACRGACAGVCKRSQPTERVSVPYFYEPSYDAVIAPIDQLVRSSGAPEQ